MYDEQGRLLGEYSPDGKLIQETIWFDDLPVATIRPKGASNQLPLGIAGTGKGTANNAGANSVANPVNVEVFYLHPDHLGTPRVATRSTAVGGATSGPNAINKAVWTWDSDPFGSSLGNSKPNENPQGVTGTASQVTAASFRVNNRFPGQLADAESGKYYNYFRDYDSAVGRYSESDPIGLKGGVNTFAYAMVAPTVFVDSKGLFTGKHHRELTEACASECPKLAGKLPWATAGVDYQSGSQSPDLAQRHAMCRPGQDPNQGAVWIQSYINYQLNTCTLGGLANALHAAQDSFAAGHRGCRVWDGNVTLEHLRGDMFPDEATLNRAREETCRLVRMFKEKCKCAC